MRVRRSLRSETMASYNGGWASRTRPRDSTAGGGSNGTVDDESAPSAGLVREAQVMPQEHPRGGDLIGPRDWLKILRFEADASSDRLGWVGLEAARYRAAAASELDQPAVTHHWLFL